MRDSCKIWHCNRSHLKFKELKSSEENVLPGIHRDEVSKLTRQDGANFLLIYHSKCVRNFFAVNIFLSNLPFWLLLIREYTRFLPYLASFNTLRSWVGKKCDELIGYRKHWFSGNRK